MEPWLSYLLKALLVSGGAVVSLAANPLIRALFRAIDVASSEGRVDEVQQTRQQLGLVTAQEELPGGRFVGIFERLTAYLCVVTGFPAGLALVVAVKGLGRYADLASAPEAGSTRKGELFIIGTFASLLWACLWGMAVTLLLRLW